MLLPEPNSHYNYYRDYDPAIGRYIQSDPSGVLGGTNSYAYVLDSPLDWRDLRGLVNENVDPNPYAVIVKCPEAPPGWTMSTPQVGKTPIRKYFPAFNPQTRHAEMMCLGDGSNNPGTGINDRGEFGWECVVECVYVSACGKQERRLPGTCLRGPKQVNL